MTDFLLVAWVSVLIEISRIGWMLGYGRRWSPGEKLKLLFAGYNGTRNTGADVRVEEMLRQVRHVLGAQHVDFSVMTFDFARTRGYFEGSRQVYLPNFFPPFLYREVRRNHGVIACEGSMFKSKFANALTTMMIGSLGIAAAENKLSLGYGAEAGHMDLLIERMCARYVRDSMIITRNPESQGVLGRLGIPTNLGTDTAWTFEPHPPEYGRQALRQAGWDETTPLLILCPIHPFMWPVKASLAKLLARATTGAFKDSQYRGPYFQASGPEVDRKYRRYISAFAKATAAFRQRHAVFPVLVGMERLDVDKRGPRASVRTDRVDRGVGLRVPGSIPQRVEEEPVSNGRKLGVPQLLSWDRELGYRFPAVGIGRFLDEEPALLVAEVGHGGLMRQVEGVVPVDEVGVGIVSAIGDDGPALHLQPGVDVSGVWS